MSDSPNYGKPVDPPRLVLYAGGGSVVWEEVVVPDGVTVIAEYSSDLSNWAPAEIVTTNDLGGGLDQVTVRRFGPGSGETQGFFRLRVELK